MKVVIIGAVAGGATAAARLRRLNEDAEIVLFDRGPHVSFANCGLPYFVGGEIERAEDLLLHTPQSLASRFRLSIRVLTEVIAINRSEKTISYRDLRTRTEGKESYDKLILSPGAAPIRPKITGVDGERIFSVRDIPDVEKIKSFITTSKATSAVVVGGGFIGLEMVEQMHHLGLKLSLVQGLPQVLGPIDPEMAELVHGELRKEGVDLYLGDPLVSFQEAHGKVVTTLASGKALQSDLVISAIGVRPESDLARAAGLEIGARGGVKVNDVLQTTDPDIYAIGDCIEVRERVFGDPAQIALAGPANRQARVAADHISGRGSTYKGTLGTAVLRVFSLTIASTGVSEKALKASKRDYHKIYLHPSNRVTYYPGASPIALKVLFSKEGKILGAQAVGREGVEKRIDVIATAIIAGLHVVELKNLELCYAPPYGSAKDPVNIAGMMAENILSGVYAQVFADDLPADAFYLDVRGTSEVAQGALPGAVNIPLPELRARLGELPKDRDIVVYCQSGQRSYFATRILLQRGFRAKNLSGAFKTYSQFTSCGVAK